MTHPIQLGVVMDPIQSINPKKDSTLAMLLEAQARGWALWYMEPGDLWIQDGRVDGRMQRLVVRDDPGAWFELQATQEQPLHRLDVVLMRKDPPFDMEYVYTTYLLELAEMRGLLVVNRPQALRDANEKVFATWFPQCMVSIIVTRSMARIRAFLHQHQRIVVKPLDGMGGTSVFQLSTSDPNIGVVLETLTARQSRFTMAQRFVEAIHTGGDKRILLVDGDPVPHALARMPAQGESRGNLAAGGKGVGADLTARDRWICDQVGPTLREKGLLFVGLDVIGDYLTEINVTSPTCIRELDQIYAINISASLLDRIESRLTAR